MTVPWGDQTPPTRTNPLVEAARSIKRLSRLTQIIILAVVAVVGLAIGIGAATSHKTTTATCSKGYHAERITADPNLPSYWRKTMTTEVCTPD